MLDGAALAAGADSVHPNVHSAAPRAAHRLHRGDPRGRALSQAPTPYLIGIFSATLAKHAFDGDSQALLVHLDFDKALLLKSAFPSALLAAFRGSPPAPHSAKRPLRRVAPPALYLPRGTVA